MKYCSQCEEKLKIYRDYDEYIEKLEKKVKKAEEDLKNLCIRLSDIRKAKAKELTKKKSEALVALNFLDVRFEMTFTQLNHYTAKGFDDAEFIISTNPGEPLRPLGKVASGGELSRIMLGIKSVLADKDEIETLIFDEIDVGISGRTAQKVSEQLAVIAKPSNNLYYSSGSNCAMADSHFIIEKQSDGQSTETYIKEINEEESIVELSRILGGAKITESIINSAREMKQLANATKKYKL